MRGVSEQERSAAGVVGGRAGPQGRNGEELQVLD